MCIYTDHIKLKLLLFLTAFFLVINVYAQQDTIQEQYSVRYLNSGIDTLPHFGNDEEELWQYIANHFRYSHQLYDETGAGWNRIILTLDADTAGNIRLQSIQNNTPCKNFNVDNLTEKEFYHLIGNMARWTPAYSKGKVVPCTFYVAMEYRLTSAGIEIKHGGIQATRGLSKKE